jgi:hypothetical protein
MYDVDLKPHFESVARSATLTGMVKAYARVLYRLNDAGMGLSNPIYEAIHREMMTADETFAAKGSKE